jgi:hypothetical protein
MLQHYLLAPGTLLQTGFGEIYIVISMEPRRFSGANLLAFGTKRGYESFTVWCDAKLRLRGYINAFSDIFFEKI